jgi:hypothetical protein
MPLENTAMAEKHVLKAGIMEGKSIHEICFKNVYNRILAISSGSEYTVKDFITLAQAK